MPRLHRSVLHMGYARRCPDIALGNQKLTVLASVYSFLQGVCEGTIHHRAERDAWFWIDSVCINQDDLEEKSQQIPLMEYIFRQSRRTIVWLGNGSSTTDEAMDFLKKLTEEAGGLLEAYQNGGPRQLIPALNDRMKWKSLQALLSHPWWRRVWTLQEFIIASKVYFLCGAKSVSRSCLNAAIYAVWLCSPAETLIEGNVWFEVWRRRRVYEWYRDSGHWDKIGLVALMAYTGACNVTDPRDRIYGLLGLASDADMSMVGGPIYTHPVGTIYTALVRAFIDTRKSLDIICFASLFRSRGPKYNEEQQLPSWVPDWRNQRDPSVIPLMTSQSSNIHIGNLRPTMGGDPIEDAVAYDAAGGSLPRVVCAENLREITCKGIFLDYIDGLGTLGRSRYPTEDDDTLRLLTQSTALDPNFDSGATLASPLPEAAQDPAKLLDAVVKSVSVGRRDRYLIEEAPTETFRRDLLKLTSLELSQLEQDRAPTVFLGLLRWYGYNKVLRIQQFTLEELCRLCQSAIGFYQRLAAESLRNGLPHIGFEMLQPLTRWTSGFSPQRKGTWDMAPRRAQKGDLICVLYGCSVPIVLRRVLSGSEEELYEFIGECYLDGFMSGEAMRLDAIDRNFVIC